MEIKFKNFAKAGTGVINLNDLTIISGPNNTGKTYINYAVFSILRNIESYFDLGLDRKFIQKLGKEFNSKRVISFEIGNSISDYQKIITKIERKVNKDLHTYFSLTDSYFPNSKVCLNFDNLEMNLKKSHHNKYRIFGDYIFAEYKYQNGKHLIILNDDNIAGKKPSNYDWILSDHEQFKSLINLFMFEVLFRQQIRIPFPITSERTGISLFHKLFENRNDEIIKRVNKEKVENHGALVNEMQSIHALSIQHNIELIRFYENFFKEKNFITSNPKKYKDLLSIHSKLLEGGEFKSDNGMFIYHPSKSDESEQPIPLQATSSSLKSLFLMDLFVKHIATPRHLLIIDEPELNLYPLNQALMARLIARLVNSGVSVMVTTHSDYIIRELNNSIMLKNANKYKGEVMKKFDYCENDILNCGQVSAYSTTNNKEIIPVTVNKFGIESNLLDEVIVSESVKTRDVRLIMEDE